MQKTEAQAYSVVHTLHMRQTHPLVYEQIRPNMFDIRYLANTRLATILRKSSVGNILGNAVL